MPDREKVLKGLECCKLYNKINCDKCPYDYNGRGNWKSECTAELASDAIVLLKEQEAVEPVKQIEQSEWTVCGNCRNHLISKWIFCPYCGRSVKWK